ncbi:hypothetical protein GYMLUDRAFT_249923 [Collybiopsis luxurians FD-317 M1]|uniref:Uncharacterized protein n=1 Tax=Collybiopsis luxurians FD-317 M1 TaxID=944289 RepID=A0A0D0CGJ3_9AGAR|nr:hypothetical protein GYMLUDRAFT_249923 [Collybiopsis luxurians FD-317 M1]
MEYQVFLSLLTHPHSAILGHIQSLDIICGIIRLSRLKLQHDEPKAMFLSAITLLLDPRTRRISTTLLLSPSGALRLALDNIVMQDMRHLNVPISQLESLGRVEGNEFHDEGMATVLAVGTQNMTGARQRQLHRCSNDIIPIPSGALHALSASLTSSQMSFLRNKHSDKYDYRDIRFPSHLSFSLSDKPVFDSLNTLHFDDINLQLASSQHDSFDTTLAPILQFLANGNFDSLSFVLHVGSLSDLEGGGIHGELDEGTGCDSDAQERVREVEKLLGGKMYELRRTHGNDVTHLPAGGSMSNPIHFVIFHPLFSMDFGVQVGP